MQTHEECLKMEDQIRRKLRNELGDDALLGRTTPGMKQFGASIHESRGRKVLRQFSQETFLEGSEDEPQ
jgi:hypothetical protein